MKNIVRPSLVLTIATLFPVHAAELKIDKEKSRIQVDVKATGHSFTCNLNDYTAKASGDKTSAAPSAFSLSWDFADLGTGDEKRDKEMIKWLGGGKQTGAFSFTKGWSDGGGMTQAEGTLTVHGVSKTISIPYTVKREGDWLIIDGTAKMNYEDFSLPIIRTMALMTVDPKLTVRFHLTGEIR